MQPRTITLVSEVSRELVAATVKIARRRKSGAGTQEGRRREEEAVVVADGRGAL